MTSPVDTSVKYFSSLMSGAPVLSGTAGSMVALLDACLKDGFDSKTLVSLVVASGVATMTWTGSHSNDVDAVVLVAGVTGGPTGFAGLNGEQKIVTKAGVGTSATFACTGVADGTATGTITIKMAPCGLAKIYTGTNKAAYQFSAVGGTGMFLRMDDSGTTFARVVGYETMSDVDTGLGAFPTAAQQSGGGYWPKSSVASATAVQWALFCDGRAFIFHLQPATGTAATSAAGTTKFFGDGVPARPSGDAYLCGLSYSAGAVVNSMIDGTLDNGQTLTVATPRSYQGLGTSQLMTTLPYVGALSAYSGSDASLGVAPSQIDGSIRLSRRFFADAITGGNPRGDVPGYYSIPQTGAFNPLRFGTKYLGSGAYNGKKFFVIQPTTTNSPAVTTAANAGAALIDVTGPWR